MMEDVSGGEGNDPEADHQAADRDDPLTGGAVVGAQGSSLMCAEKLPTEADDHEQNAECESEPCHGLPMYRIRCTTGKREIEDGLGRESGEARKGMKTEVEESYRKDAEPKFRHEANL